jgi:hypothetical protein
MATAKLKQSKLSDIEKLFASKLDLADKKLQAENNVKAEIHKNKEEILREFCKPIWEFMLYVHHKSGVTFARFHDSRGNYEVRLITTYSTDYINTDYNEKSFEEGMKRLGYCGDTALGYVTFTINDSYQPYAYFGHGNAIENNKKYTSAEEFIDEMTNRISRKKKQ